MGAFMVLKVQCPKENIEDVMEILDTQILKSYIFGEIIELYLYGYYGYAEPVEEYKRVKYLVDDIWWLEFTPNALIGRNMKARWNSCKKEYVESEEY